MLVATEITPPGQPAPVARPRSRTAGGTARRDRRHPRRPRAMAQLVSHSRLPGAVDRCSRDRVRGRQRAAGECRSAVL